MTRKTRVARRRLASARADRPGGKISQRDVAYCTGISLDRYWRIENGYAEATPDERTSIAAVLGVSARALDFSLRSRDIRVSA